MVQKKFSLLFTFVMAFIIFHTLFLCSECKEPLKLFPADKIPENCPNCQAVFDHENSTEIRNEREHSGLDYYEKWDVSGSG